MLLDIASGLHCLHCHRIIHADLKPANVLVKGGGIKTIRPTPWSKVGAR